MLPGYETEQEPTAGSQAQSLSGNKTSCAMNVNNRSLGLLVTMRDGEEAFIKIRSQIPNASKRQEKVMILGERQTVDR
jgi:hypothetical protein